MSSDSLVLDVVIAILIVFFILSGLVLRRMRKEMEARTLKIPLLGAKTLFGFERRRLGFRR